MSNLLYLLLSVSAIIFVIKFLRHPQIGFYALLIAIIFPFQVFFEHSRAYLICDALVLLILGLSLMRGLLNGESMKIDKGAKIIFVFLIFNFGGVIYVSHYVADDRLYTIFYQLFTIVKGLLLYVIAFNLIKDSAQVKVAATVLALIAIATSCYFIYEHTYVLGHLATDEYRAADFYNTLDDIYSDDNSGIIKAWMGGPNGRAKFSLLLFAFILGYMNFKESFAKNFVYWTALAITTVSIVLQMSRSSYGFFLFLVLLYVLKNSRLRHSGFPKIVIVGLLGVLFFYALSESPYAQDKLQDLSRSDSASNTRMNLASDAILAASSNLFLGNGFYGIQLAPQLFYQYDSFRTGVGTHNTYLEILLDAGMPGLIAFISFLILSFRNSKRLETLAGEPNLRHFASGAQFLIIAASLNFLTAHGILKNTMLFGLAWLIIGCCNGLLWRMQRGLLASPSDPMPQAPVGRVFSRNKFSNNDMQVRHSIR